MSTSEDHDVSHRRDSVAMATQFADEERRRRIQEEYYSQLEAEEEQEERRQWALAEIENERQERIQQYMAGDDAGKRQQARRTSIQFIHDAFGWNNAADREELKGMDEMEALSFVEEHSERQDRGKQAAYMAAQEQQRRLEEQYMVEEEHRRMAQEEAHDMWEQARAEQIQDYEEHGQHKQNAARRQSMSMMLEAEGNVFQKRWTERNYAIEDEDDDEEYSRPDEDEEEEEAMEYRGGVTTRDLFAMEQEARHREMVLQEREAEAEARIARIEAARAMDAEQQRRIEEQSDVHRAPLALMAQQASRQGRRRSIANVYQEPQHQVEVMSMEQYQEWAENVIFAQAEDLERATRAVEALTSQVQETTNVANGRLEQVMNMEEQLYCALSEMSGMRGQIEETEDIANNNAEAAYEREEQLQQAMLEIRQMQDKRYNNDGELDSVYAQLQRLRVHDHTLEDRLEKTESMLEDALLELQKVKKEKKREQMYRMQLEKQLQN